MTDKPLFENSIIEDCCSLVEDSRVRDIDALLEDLPFLRGAGFISQLKEITVHPSFNLVKNENYIFSTGGESSEDYDNLLKTARKAVEHGYRVFILPNPKGIRTADYIFERKGVFKMFDLKTISGKNSVGNRMSASRIYGIASSTDQNIPVSLAFRKREVLLGVYSLAMS